jgi:gamma-glutamylcyclotransferase (GGCT)/AIG2-like uncharacterized protein YtfP
MIVVCHCDGRRAAYHLRTVESRGNPALFVYGSLKRGGCHHTELRGAPFLGEASTAPGYALEELQLAGVEYVALVPRPRSPGTVSGEVFQVDVELLALLDEFEGPEYRRALIELEFPGRRFALAYLRRTR